MKATQLALRAARLRSAYITSEAAAVRLPTITVRSIQTTRQPATIRSPSVVSQTPIRAFTSSTCLQAGLMPDAEIPKAPNTQDSGDEHRQEPADITEAEYHEISDQYMNTLQLSLEEIADDASKNVEVEYSAGVLTLTHPSKGIYVLNKQPPNKQIWLSSPESGPKRFDWVLSASGGMDSKQDTEGSEGDVGDNGHLGGGKWTYLRDGTTLSRLLNDELGVVLSHGGESDVNTGREGPGASGAGGGTGVEG